jgi:alkylation response protein AidB-like acyl-CoA dehydrogenase
MDIRERDMESKPIGQRSPQSAAGAQTGPALIERARTLSADVRAAADEIEATRELPRPLFEALADAGFFHLAVPKAVGGIEIDLPTYTRIIEEIGKADASTAWCVNQGAIFGTYAARVPVATARAIWIDPPRSVVANTPAPVGKAIPVPGGYKVTGRHPFSTGCRHATWLASQSQVIENGEPRMQDGKPESRYCLVRASEAEIHDTWRTRGMRGTGTHHWSVNDVFVPAERTFLYANAPLQQDGPLYKVPRTLAFACGDSAVALAVARSCLEAFIDLAGAKSPRYMTGLLRDVALTQFTVGRAEAALRSGRAFLMEAIDEIWDEVLATGAASLEKRSALRLATTHGIRLGCEIVESLYSAAGATAAFEGHVMQRHFQDIHVITQHVQGRLSHYELVGKIALGIPVQTTHL